MTIKPFYKVFAALLASLMMVGASANSVSLSDQGDGGPYGIGDTVTISINFDFTGFAMLGGGLDLFYDNDALEFVAFDQAAWSGAGNPQAGGLSPIGALREPGAYVGFGIGTFDFQGGITTANSFGTFTFTILDAPSITPTRADTPCGFIICLSETVADGMGNLPNPFTSTDFGLPIGADALGLFDSANGGQTTLDLDIQAQQIPVPAAIWFLVSGLGALVGFRRKA